MRLVHCGGLTVRELPVVDDPEEAAFQRLFGPWAALDPVGVAELLDGFQSPWWIVGGWALEALSGVRRRHEDIDSRSSAGTCRGCASISDPHTTAGPLGRE